MAKIYETFDDLVKKNKSIFALANSGPGEGHHLGRAIWEVREAEIHQYAESLGEKNVLIEKLEGECGSLQEENESLVKANRSLEKEKKGLEAKWEKTASTAKEYRDTSDRELAALREEKKNLEREISFLRERARELEELKVLWQEREIEYRGAFEERDKALGKLKAQEEGPLREALGLRPRIEDLEKNLAKRDSYIRSLEFAHKSARLEGEESRREREDLEKVWRETSENLAREKGITRRLAEALEERDNRIGTLGVEIREREAYARRYREINNGMSVEMDRMARELETLRGAFTDQRVLGRPLDRMV